MCATERNRSSTAGDQTRSVSIVPNARTPSTSSPTLRGNEAFDLGP